MSRTTKRGPKEKHKKPDTTHHSMPDSSPMPFQSVPLHASLFFISLFERDTSLSSCLVGTRELVLARSVSAFFASRVKIVLGRDFCHLPMLACLFCGLRKLRREHCNPLVTLADEEVLMLNIIWSRVICGETTKSTGVVADPVFAEPFWLVVMLPACRRGDSSTAPACSEPNSSAPEAGPLQPIVR